MKLKLFFLFAIACIPAFSFGQSALTIFSEDGDKFYLVLNGQKQNTVAQTNIRIDGLSQPYYNAKIIFEDKAKNEISKNLPVVDPSTNAFADVTYKIKKTKDGDMKMRYFSAIPVEPNYVAPPDMYVMHFGAPAPAAASVTETTVTTTTTTQPGANMSMGVGAGGVNMNVNVSDPTMGGNGGVNMSINVADPAMNTAATQTTTTRTTTTYASNTTTTGYGEPQRVAQGCQYPMDMNSFRSAKESVSKASFEETKLSTAKTIMSSNCFSAEQVKQICQLFSFEESKVEFAKCAYGKCTDKGNYFKIGDIFSFDASREELNNYISGH